MAALSVGPFLVGHTFAISEGRSASRAFFLKVALQLPRHNANCPHLPYPRGGPRQNQQLEAQWQT